MDSAREEDGFPKLNIWQGGRRRAQGWWLGNRNNAHGSLKGENECNAHKKKQKQRRQSIRGQWAVCFYGLLPIESVSLSLLSSSQDPLTVTPTPALSHAPS